jgi:drug/metabolite transporter (DMT)-like permease
VRARVVGCQVRHGLRVGLEVALACLLIVAGLVMLVTPGPGLLTLAAGVALLGRHNRWTRRLGRTIVEGVSRVAAAARSKVAPRDRDRIDRDLPEDES